MPNARIIAAPNALYSRDLMGAGSNGNPTNFIYVGRLVKEKKPDLLIRAFARAGDRLGKTCRLLIVGDGPERPRLEELARDLGDRVEFKGHVAGWEQLRGFYATSIAGVSPGYAGLSLTQSYSFGVPMIIARDEPHAPEIEAANEANNAFFASDDVDDLADTLTQFWKQRKEWASRGEAIASDCAERYSAEVMAERLIEAAWPDAGPVLKLAPDRPIAGPLSMLRNALRYARLQRHRVSLREKLTTGRNVTIGKHSVLLPPDFARFGDNVSIAGDFRLEANLDAGSDILISSNVAFVGNDHRFDDPDSTVFWQGRNPSATIVLEGDNLIGHGVIVVGDVRIGRGCIVGAGAVVTSDLPANTVCVGMPARPIRERFEADGPVEIRAAA
jgi:acetyltransferase-like isoleucine patch superfamily enzyme